MSATLRLREASDETAELQDLLSRLQTSEVGGEFVGGTWDGYYKTVNYLHGINCKKILSICDDICTAQKDADDIAKFKVETNATFLEFMDELKLPLNKKQEKANMNKLAAIWKRLRPEMQWYVDTYVHTETSAATTHTHVVLLLGTMAKFERGWTDEFKKK